MLKKISLLVFLVMFTIFPCLLAPAIAPKKIQLRLRLEQGDNKKRIEILQYDIAPKNHSYERDTLYKSGVTNVTSWEFNADKPFWITIQIFGEPQNTVSKQYVVWIGPGADITLDISNEKLQVSGPGSETFRAEMEEISPQRQALKAPKSQPGKPLESIEDFNDWNEYLDSRVRIINNVIDKYSKKYPSEVWESMKVSAIADIESRRCERFQWLSQFRKNFNLEKSDIDSIYHNVIFKKQQWLFSYDKEVPALNAYYRIVMITPIQEMLRPITDPANSYFYGKAGAYENIRTTLRHIDSVTTGKLKEQLTTFYILGKIAVTGHVSVVNDILPYAFENIKTPETRAYILRKLVDRAQMSASEMISGFSFQDPDGKPVTRKDMNYKTLVFHMNDLDDPGSKPDLLFQAAFNEFKENPEVIIAEISYGASFAAWQQKIKNDPFKKAGMQYLYSPATGDHMDYIQNIHSVLKTPTHVYYQYKPHSHENTFTSNRFNAALRKNGMDSIAATLEVIRTEAAKYDGPHLRTSGDTTFVYKVTASRFETDTLSARPSTVEVITSPGTTFPVKINTKLPIPSSSYPMPEKALFLSDLEGNFDTFRRLLITHKVMDSMYNWTFEKGHLVITGDVFDRGRKVTGCLWLIYMLENKANEAGGAVHFILGNHEVMNLTGDYSYVYPDYQRFAEGFGLEYSEWYDQRSVLGKWLRSKNIMEIIGDNLVTHGGISPAINALELTVDEINNKHRSFLAGNTVSPSDTAMRKILSSSTSPYWYRGYYRNFNSTLEQMENVVDRTLMLYRVNRIITGHTIVENVSGFYNGKVINTDTRHASGDSEGLLIENGNYYRVSINGIKEKLQ